MTNKRKQIFDEIKELYSTAHDILRLFILIEEPEMLSKEDKKKYEDFRKESSLSQRYQSWYSRALPAVRTILPDRVDEFVELYKTDPKRK